MMLNSIELLQFQVPGVPAASLSHWDLLQNRTFAGVMPVINDELKKQSKHLVVQPFNLSPGGDDGHVC